MNCKIRSEKLMRESNKIKKKKKLNLEKCHFKKEWTIQDNKEHLKSFKKLLDNGMMSNLEQLLELVRSLTSQYLRNLLNSDKR